MHACECSTPTPADKRRNYSNTIRARIPVWLILCFLVSVYGICIGRISWPSVGISRHIHVRCAFWEGAGRTVIIIPHKYTVLFQLLRFPCVCVCVCETVSVHV